MDGEATLDEHRLTPRDRKNHRLMRAECLVVSTGVLAASVALPWLSPPATWLLDGSGMASFLASASTLGSLACGALATFGAIYYGRGARRLRPPRGSTYRRTAIVLAASVPIACAAFVLLWRSLGASNDARDAAFAALAERSTPLVEAILAYEEARGRPPFSLEDLVPEYIESVPTTGIEIYPAYRYVARRSHFPGAHLVAYDLGPWPKSATRPANADGSKYWMLDDLGHAGLVLLVDEGDEVIGVDTDRIPDRWPSEPFDAERWRDGPPGARLAMLEGLLAEIDPLGGDMAELELLLGPPDAVDSPLGPPEGRPWDLSVPCPLPLAINWDVFYYSPVRDDPEDPYGGYGERFGDWVYFHE